MTKLVALQQLASNVYGIVQAGQEFEVEDDLARELLHRGYVKHAGDPEIKYETQAIVPQETPEVSPRRPFRHGALRHAKPPQVDTENAGQLPKSDVPKP